MLKLYENQKNTIYKLQKILGLPPTTLYHYAKGRRNIDNIPAFWLIQISQIEGVEVNKLFKEMKKYQGRLKNETNK